MLVKLEPIESSAITPMAAWLLVLNDSAVPDASASDFAVLDIPASDTFKVQEPEFKLYPELQLVHTAELVAEHIWQLLAVHFWLLLAARIIYPITPGKGYLNPKKWLNFSN